MAALTEMSWLWNYTMAMGSTESQMAGATAEKETVSIPATVLEKSTNYIEQIYKIVAGIYYNELGKLCPSIKEKVQLRTYSNADPIVRKKYYIDQLHHILNEYMIQTIEKDSPLAGQLDSRASITYNHDQDINFLAYRMPEEIADMYAHTIASLCIMKSTAFMTKVLSQDLFINSGNIGWDHVDSADLLRITMPVLGAYTKEQYANFAGSTRRGRRNQVTFGKMTHTLIYGLLGVSPLSINNRFLDARNRYTDMPLVRAAARTNASLTYSGRTTDNLKRLSYLHLSFLRLLNSIENTGNIFQGYSRNARQSYFMKMIQSDTTLLPIWDAMMLAVGYPQNHSTTLGGSDFQFDISNIQEFLGDLYGWSDQYSSEMMDHLSRDGGSILGNTNHVFMRDAVDPAMFGNLAENLMEHPAIRAAYTDMALTGAAASRDIIRGIGQLEAELLKAKPGSLHNNHELFHRGNSFYYPNYHQMADIAGNNATNNLSANRYDPALVGLTSTMYIAGDTLASELTARNNQTIVEEDVKYLRETASTNFHPASIIAGLMSKRNPAEVFGFEVADVPTPEDITRIKTWLMERCKLVFVTSDPVQGALRASLRQLQGGREAQSIRLMRAYKMATAVASWGNKLTNEIGRVTKHVSNIAYPFRISKLSACLAKDKYQNLATAARAAIGGR